MRTLKECAYYRYHQQTKHSTASLHSEAHYLDWENQPNPFRYYQGTDCVSLEFGNKHLSGNFFKPPTTETKQFISLKTLSLILYYSLSISAWKKYEDTTWHLRVNPSAGNLHPEEVHLVTYDVDGLKPGIYHYNVYEHLLETRSNKPFEPDEWKSIGIQETTELFSTYLIVNAIPWRHAWKYQRRALRYCFHDAGHVIGSLQYIFEQMKLHFKVFVKISSKKLQKLSSLKDEIPLIVIGFGKQSNNLTFDNSKRIYNGKANTLSENEVLYPLIEEIKCRDLSVDEINSQPQGKFTKDNLSTKLKSLKKIKLNHGLTNEVKNFFSVVRSRRSAQSYDRKSEMDLDDLAVILKKAFEKSNLDYDSVNSCLIDVFLFVHRVKDLERGLYLYNEPENEISLLHSGNMEATARSLSLSQEIASDSSVCFVMVANFVRSFDLLGEIGYKAVHFEAGRIGQALYLGSESLNYNSTGIGAFFDDDVNQFLQLREGYEVIYHFAMGKALTDKRLQTLEGYHHLRRSNKKRV